MSKFDGGILAIDAATTTGWCHGKPGGKLTFGSIRFGQKGQERAVTYRALREWLMPWVCSDFVSLVVFESAAIPMTMQGHTKADTIKKLIGLTEHIEEVCYQRKELREASASDVRSFFLGSNRHRSAEAKKMTMQKCRDLGHDVEDDNAGDAVALHYFQVAHLRPDLAVTMTPMFGRSGRVVSSW